MTMTKIQLKRKLRSIRRPCTNKAIAELFGIREQAVQKWRTIPPLRLYELRDRMPELFV